MDWHYKAGTVAALIKIGVQLDLPFSNADKVRNFIKVHPKTTAGGVVGGVVGGLLAGRTLLSKEEPSPRMEPPIIGDNPLYSNIHE
jgi:hypothetical protein